MEFWFAIIVMALPAAVLGLGLKLYFFRKAAREIEREFEKRLNTETNTLIDISSRDLTMTKLAAGLNRQLVKLREQRHRFQQGDRELKDAVTNISHDLRTPLTAIYGYLELLAQEEKSEEVSRYLAQIESRVDVMKQLTEELFRFSVVSSAREENMEELDLRCALEETLVSFYGAMQQRGITPQIEITDTAVMRTLDAAAVERIFNNIISNALKYSDGDLQVTMNEGGTVIFSNSAKDMDTVAAARLFDRFYTVENARNSTGLGLSIAKLLTERMGGAIESECAAGKLYIIVKFPA